MASPTAPPPPTGALRTPEREGVLPVPAEVSSDGAVRLRNGRAFFLPHGHRRTPDHPPYSEMIQVALTALAEEGGSTAAAISGRVAAVYPDLPWAHERLLPHYLRRLVAAGDVSVASPGRYVLSPSPAPTGNADPHPNPNPNLNTCSGSTSLVFHPADTAAALDSGAGEGLGARALTGTMAAASSGGDGESKSLHPSIPVTAVCHDVDDGRPSMPVPASVAALAVRKDERPLEHDHPSSTISGHHTCFPELKTIVKRGRGRPPLRARGRGRPPLGVRSHSEPAPGTCVSDHGYGGILLRKCVNGRPSNSFILKRQGQESYKVFKPAIPPRRRRGRPPKCKPTVATLDTILANEDAHLLNFTSSHDPKHAEPSGDTSSSLSLGDNTSSAGHRGLSKCSAASRPGSILQLPSIPEPKLANDSLDPDQSSLADQLTVHVPKRQRTAIEHKPRNISTTLIEEMVSNEPLIQSSEQVVCALPASIDSSSNNVVRSRPQIEGWVQVLLAMRPTTTDMQRAKGKKSRWHCDSGKLVCPTEQFTPENFLLTRDRENMDQVDACLQTSVSKHSSGDGLLQAKVDGNRAHMEKFIFSPPILDPYLSFQNAEKENQLHVDKGQESVPNIPFQVMERDNGPHDIEGRQTLHIGHSLLDSSLQTGNGECRTQAGLYVESLSSDKFMLGYSLQTSLENAANMEGSMQLPAESLSSDKFMLGYSLQTSLENAANMEGSMQLPAVGSFKPADELNGEEEKIRLHAEVYVSELPAKQLLNGELFENDPQDERSVEEFPVEEFAPKGDIRAEEVSVSHAKRSLQVLPKFGVDLQTEVYVSELPAKQLLNGELLENDPQDERSVEEFPVEESAPKGDIQAEEVSVSHAKRSLQVLPKFGVDLQTEDKTQPFIGERVLTCAAEQHTAGDPLQNQKSGNWPQVEEFVQHHAECSMPVHDLQSEKKNKSQIEGHMQMLPCEQAKLQDGFPFENDKNGTHAMGCFIELSTKDPTISESSLMHQLQDGSHDGLFNQELSAEQKNPEDKLQTEDSNQIYDEKSEQVLREEQPQYGVKLLNQADDNGRCAEGCVLALPVPDKGQTHGNYLQAQELEIGPHDEKFTQEIHTDQCPAEDYLQMDNIESHANEGVQVFPQEQHKPGDDLQMEEHRNREHTEGLALQSPLNKSSVSEIVQTYESESILQTGEFIQEPPLKLSKHECLLKDEETNGHVIDDFLQSPITEQSNTDDPLQLKREKNVSSKKNKKRPPSRRLWFEG